MMMQPIPVPEPPRVVCTRPTIPDPSLLVSQEFGDNNYNRLEYNTGTPINLAKRFNTVYPASRQQQPKTSWKPLTPPTVSASKQRSKQPLRVTNNNLPVTRDHQVHKEMVVEEKPSAEVSRMCQLLEKHDHQLQEISKQIERLLTMNSSPTVVTNNCRCKQSSPRLETPPLSCSSSSPMTSPSTRIKSIVQQRRKKSTITTTLRLQEDEDVSDVVETGRKVVESEDTFYRNMSRNIDDILLRQSEDESFHGRRSRPHLTMSPPSTPSTKDYYRKGSPGPETVYIKQLASKYMSDKTIAFRGGRDLFSTQETTPRSGRDRKLLDMNKIQRQTKFV